MRIALVHDWLTGMRGGERVLEAVADRFPTAPIHTLIHVSGNVSPAIEDHPIVTSFLQGIPGIRHSYRHFLPLFPSAIEDFDLSGFDLVISTSHCVAKGAIPEPGARHVCYCFTPMRYAWDQEHAYFPRRRGPVARLRGLILSRLRQWDVASSPRVDRFVAISRHVADRIRRYYGRESEVLAPPADVEFFTPGAGEDRGRPYALAVAALVPYKRLELAVAACDRVGLELVVVGHGPERRRLERIAGGGTTFLGRVERERLRDLYRGADVYVQPGVEDFGIASVEALACGTPVVALDRGGVRDIVENGVHGVLSVDRSPAALAGAIDSTRDMRFNEEELRTRGEAFSVDSFMHGFDQIVGEATETTRP